MMDDGACVRSGYCCKQAPCPYGERSIVTGWCLHLEELPEEGLGVQRYRCARYEFIERQPLAELVPAFGAGCSSRAFNTDRERVLVALRRKEGRP